jgi:hypothetical protein
MLRTLLCFLAAATPLVAQEVLVPFHLIRDGRPVTDFSARDIRLLEDSVVRPFSSFRAVSSVSPSPFSWMHAQPPIPVDVFLFFDTVSSWRLPREDFDSFQDAVLTIPGVQIAIYRYSGQLRRYGELGTDSGALSSSFTQAIARLPRGGTPVPLPKPAKGTEHSWDEMILGAARDAAAHARPNSVRLMVSFHGGLPDGPAEAEEMARVFQGLGIALYPFVWAHKWVAQEERTAGQGHADMVGLTRPIIPGMDWIKMTAAQQLQWLEKEESFVITYESLSERTGGLSVRPYKSGGELLDTVVDDIKTLYVVGVTPDPGKHRLEVQSLDPHTSVR